MRHLPINTAEAKAFLTDVHVAQETGGRAEGVSDDQVLVSQLALLARQIERLRISTARLKE